MMDLERGEGPVAKLVNAILLSAIKKKVSVIELRRGDRSFIVYFTIDGVEHEEMRPPLALHTSIVRRLSVMSWMPYLRKGETGHGNIYLVFGRGRRAHFGVRLEGHTSVAQVWLALFSVTETNDP